MDIINQIQAGLAQIEKALSKLQIGALPYVVIADDDVCESLPMRTAAVYFLTHPTEGLLYIGKAKNVRSRWGAPAYRQHDCLEMAIRLRDVRLSWWALPESLLGVVEESLIRMRKPKWNGHNGKGHIRNEAIDRAWEERSQR